MNQQQWLHFIGIKGVGMSALAIVAQGMGYKVTGSDVAEEFITDSSLKDAGITPFEGFQAKNISKDIDLVVLGAAFGKDNPEIETVRELGLATISYAKLLGELAAKQKTVAIAGTHGKTTTTSMTSFLLAQAGKDPSWVIGTGHVSGLPAHGHAGKGAYFITEADDYKISHDDPRPKFAELTPDLAVITSIEHDHPDMYPTLEDCIRAFEILVKKVPKSGKLVVNADDATIQNLIAQHPDKQFITYGFSDRADYRCEDVSTGFRLFHNGEEIGEFVLHLPGKHNVYNATAATIVALEAGVSIQDIQTILPNFKTVERRYEHLGTAARNIIVIDDYAHHPTAVTTTLEAAKKQHPTRPLWVVFQAHTYSRTKTLLKEFGAAFGPADTVIITDIFGSAREAGGNVTAEDLKNEIAKHHQDVRYVPKDGMLEYLKDSVPANAVLLTMGAGDIYKIGKELVTNSAN